jgi:hypothetical protein
MDVTAYSRLRTRPRRSETFVGVEHNRSVLNVGVPSARILFRTLKQILNAQIGLVFSQLD